MQYETKPNPQLLRMLIEQQLEQNNNSVTPTDNQKLANKTLLSTQLKPPVLKLLK